ncbi:TPA: nucleotidyltransferase [Vibrio parahaemolyticus]|uniref:nucleotidyltransferase domain-containing protein n=1 Tax=Vibrio parahaemolyticus TaxID=670 RepID=UPI0004083B69|nr:nucleotidyltransferase [Vibrio parahaemolyticus]EGR3453426.1 nucleotidyltransferase [Vibrio parahaemolyticus]EJV0605864.1 nucleotidyltransferase [Vibrio parahaemolyticus]ELB2064878.1 nucleotidyltransferase [Vibrio parahaemolyticus]ELB2113658.1 nucleotidyltransferase [Vibrio parahaemolyticus]ELJ8839692.1 nucleotidyltransferase [Vibrio parahaemolyticus]
MSVSVTKQADTYLEALAKALEIPQSRYEQAEKSYKSVGEWLHREESTVKDYSPDVYVQGSFRLGLVIKPLSAQEEYDIDCACSLTYLDKSSLSQQDLKVLMGDELELYRKSKGIKKPVAEQRRCWRLEYADGAQFHMDVVPCIPNAEQQRLLLEQKNFDTKFAETAIAITDNEVLPQYYQITSDWPRSNPRGYAEWFKFRMGENFERKRREILKEMETKGIQASIEDIPSYRVRTPLQSAIMILKRHRDMMFEDNSKDKPISIILTTLSAHAYQGEDSIGSALLSILFRMEEGIHYDGHKYVINNPTDAMENFADKWETHPERAEAFFSWLSQAREDFYSVGQQAEHRRMSGILESRIGQNVTNQVYQDLSSLTKSGASSLLSAATAASTVATPSIAFGDVARKPKKPDGFA